MRTMIGPRQGVPAERVIPLDVDAVPLHELDERAGHPTGTHRVQDHLHLNAGAGAVGESLGELPSDVAIPVNVELEIDRFLRPPNGRKHRWKDPSPVPE